MAELDYSKMDNEIEKRITALRKEFGACTAHLVARRMKMSRDVIRYRLTSMRAEHRVQWNEVPGSLRLMSKADAAAAAAAEKERDAIAQH